MRPLADLRLAADLRQRLRFGALIQNGRLLRVRKLEAFSVLRCSELGRITPENANFEQSNYPGAE